MTQLLITLITLLHVRMHAQVAHYGLVICVSADIDPLEGVTTVIGDFTIQTTQDKIREILSGRPIDLIMRHV